MKEKRTNDLRTSITKVTEAIKKDLSRLSKVPLFKQEKEQKVHGHGTLSTL